MERSIENIWKEGFESDDNIQIPVVQDLYRKKSKLIIERIKSSSRIDNISLVPMAVILAGVFIFMEKPVLGIYVGILILLLFLLNRRKLRQLEDLKLSANTYLYLTNYYSKIKGLQKYYTILLGIGLPVLILPGYYLYFRGTTVLSTFDGMMLQYQILVVAILSIVLSAIGVLSYRISTHLIYSKLLTRLEEIIKDLEELMKAN